MLALVKVTRKGNRSTVALRPVATLTGLVFVLVQLMAAAYVPALKLKLRWSALVDLGKAVWELADMLSAYVAVLVDVYLEQVEILARAFLWALLPRGLRV